MHFTFLALKGLQELSTRQQVFYIYKKDVHIVLTAQEIPRGMGSVIQEP